MASIILKFQSTENEYKTHYLWGNLEVTLTLMKGFSITENYTFSLFNDQLHYFGCSMTSYPEEVKRCGRRKLCVTFPHQSVWLPGRYFMLMQGEAGVVRTDFTIDEEQQITLGHPFVAPPCGMEEAIASSLPNCKLHWRQLSHAAGMKTVREWAVDRLRVEMLNSRRRTMELPSYEMNDNLWLGFTSPYIKRVIHALHPLVFLQGDWHEVNCETLFDVTRSNPYEELEQVVSSNSSDNPFDLYSSSCNGRFLCLNKAGALLRGKGGILLQRLTDGWPNHKLHMAFCATPQELAEMAERHPQLLQHIPQQNRITQGETTLEDVVYGAFSILRERGLKPSPMGMDRWTQLLSEIYHRGDRSLLDHQRLQQWVDEMLLPAHQQRCLRDIYGLTSPNLHSEKVNSSAIEKRPHKGEEMTTGSRTEESISTAKDLSSAQGVSILAENPSNLSTEEGTKRSDSSEKELLLLQPEELEAFTLMDGGNSWNQQMKELNSMVGLRDIKQQITTLCHRLRFFQKRHEQGLACMEETPFHALFFGNPGTGKTTVAKMLGRIYHQLGLLSRGEVVYADRKRIVGQYIGETEANMNQLIQEARGNVLFIDEAYTLYAKDNERDFGRQAIESLLDVLAEKNGDILVIMAGYEREMKAMMEANQGLEGRFPYTFRFPDYNAEELYQIAIHRLDKGAYRLTHDANQLFIKVIQHIVSHKTDHFSNARWAEQFVSNGLIPAMADRLAETLADAGPLELQTITTSDVEEAYQRMTPIEISQPSRRRIGFKAA